MTNYPIEFTETKTEIKVKFNQKKFGTKHLDTFAHLFYIFLKKKKIFLFDFSNLSWIAHEELVYLSGVFDQLYNNNIGFKITFKKDNPSVRQIKTVIYLWENWQIFSFIPKQEILKHIHLYFDLTDILAEATKKTLQVFFNKTDQELEEFINSIIQSKNKSKIKSIQFFDIDINYINQLKETLVENLDIELENYFHKITPFVKLKVPTGNLDEKIISYNLDKIYDLDKRTQTLLKTHSSNSPFLNKTLSSIITKELYENSIEHAYSEKKIKNQSCYLSVSLKNKINENGNWDRDEINSFNEMNFKDEALISSKNFFSDKDYYKNQSLLQFTFLDFGSGIPFSLKQQFKKQNNGIDESDILEHAFEYTSSRYPLAQKYLENNHIPRGLYDVVSIVKRYKGLIIVRSNYGKLLYDFSINAEIKNCLVKYDKSNTKYFNGTLITILIPENSFGIELKSIKPQYLIEAYKKIQYYVSVLDIQKEAIKAINLSGVNELVKKQLYNETLNRLSAIFDKRQNENCCIFVDFNGCHMDSQIAKKILFYLTSDYRINEKTNTIIINPPSKELILEIQLEILNSPEEKKNFIFHPLPCVFQNANDAEIIWIGVGETEPYKKLNNVLFSVIHNESLSDFDSKDRIAESGLFNWDKHGNIITLVGNIEEQSIFNISQKSTLQKEDAIYLCSGNYYQYKYIALLEQLYDFDESNRIAYLLHKKIEQKIELLKETTHFLAITLSSQLIANAFISQLPQIISNRIQFVKLSNYHSYHLEDDFIQKISKNDKVIVICDVISTGYLITSLKEKLSIKSASLQAVISIFDTRSSENKGSIKMFYENDVPTFFLKNISIDKYKRDEIEDIYTKDIIRINPVTNTPITLEVNKSELKHNVLFSENDFLSQIDFPENYIKIGYFRYNNLFHPYFFETRKLFKSQNGIEILKNSIKEISNRIDLKIDFVFYPIFSGAEEIKTEEYKSNVFNNHSIEFIPLARFNTPNGWRFTFPPKFLNSKTADSNIFILDDGSCTGSTIIQMIDEISFLDVKTINLLSIIGRTDDYLREFYSRIKTVKVKHLNDELLNVFNLRMDKHPNNEVPINIFFASQWQIPTYPLSGAFPFINEEKQLNYLLNLENLPSLLAKYVNKRMTKIRLNNVDDSSILKYLPTDSNNEIPIIDLLLTRNQLGKINGYRFYKDYFECFNNYTESYYNKSNSSIILSQTELFLAVILHEPYLIRSIQDFLPDVYEILLEVTHQLVNNNAHDSSPNINNLNLNWERASLVSVYLNLRKTKVKDLLAISNLSSLMSFISLDESMNSLRIFLMYILNFVPTTKLELHKQEDGILCLNELTEFINSNTENNTIPNVFSNLKLFKSFLNTIPYLDKDLASKKVCLLKIKQFFNEEKSLRSHDSVEKQLGIIKSQSKQISFSNDLFSSLEYVKEIKKAWKVILPRIEQLQRYSIRLIGFFDVYKKGVINQELFVSSKNLFKVSSAISEIIENEKVIEKWSIIHDYSKNILISNFFSEDAFINQLFLDFETKEIINVWDMLMNPKIHNILNDNTIPELESFNNLTIKIPLLYLKDVIFEEIRKNFRYSDENHSIHIHWEIREKDLSLQIKNKIGKNGSKGGRNGFQTMELLTNLLEFKFLKPKIENDYFIQEYNFKIE